MTSVRPDSQTTLSGYRLRAPGEVLHDYSVSNQESIDYLDGILPSMDGGEVTFDSANWRDASSKSHEDREIESAELIRTDIQQLIKFGKTSLPPRRFEMIQQFEGIVTEVTEDSLMADIADLTDPSNPVEFVEIPFREITPEDLRLVVPGAVFYWSMGYETSSNGQVRRVSEIRVRRNPIWSQRMVDDVSSAATKLFAQLDSNAPQNTPSH